MFTDVGPELASYDAIKFLKDKGFVFGVGHNEYKPFDTATRAHMAVFLLRADKGAHYSPPAPTGFIPDVDAVSYWGASWIEAAVNEGLMDRYPDDEGNFYPHNPATRADIAVLTWVLLK